MLIFIACWLLLSKRVHLKNSLAKKGTSAENFGGPDAPSGPCFGGSAILDNDGFETKIEIKEKEDKEINDEIDWRRLLDEINTGHTSSELEFYFGGPNRKFFLICSGSNLNRDNSDFIDFLSSDIGSQIFRENMLSIHIKTRNIFSDNYNTGESIYNFLLKQQGDTKKNNSCNIDLHRFFLKLHFKSQITYFLDDIDAETVDKFNFFVNKMLNIFSTDSTVICCLDVY